MSDSRSHLPPDWRQLRSPADVADTVTDLYRRKGAAHYEEAVSQLEHALQCGAYALEAQAAKPLVVAAFLHDVGHLLDDEQGLDERTGGASSGHDRRHEELGADFVSTWFPESVAGPIRRHVAAKRYLCAVEPSYHDGLSPASVRSLQLQGGPMQPVEAHRFAAMDHGRAAAELRRWDDRAKVVGARTPPIDRFHDLMVDVLSG